MQDTQHNCLYGDTCPSKTIGCKGDSMTNVISKVVIPNKEWIIEDHGEKIGSVAKLKKGYEFFRHGKRISFKDLKDLTKEFGNNLFEDKKVPKFEIEPLSHRIYDFPCSSKPYEAVYNVKKKLPLFAKSAKSKSQYCAGYYVIKFRKGWVKSFCPKLITLERYPFHGPFKSEAEMKTMLTTVNKNETT
jgi:hypothetical protein